MLLYLVQHADAKSEKEDPARGLSEKGIQNITKVAQYISRLDIRVFPIIHSGKARAMQTARVLSDYLKMEKGVAEQDGLSPMDDPKIWFERIARKNEDIMLVGHLPHLSRLASLLLCGNQDVNIVDFKMGGVVCLGRRDDGTWAVEWMIPPEVIK